jgi:hypothetical protein
MRILREMRPTLREALRLEALRLEALRLEALREALRREYLTISITYIEMKFVRALAFLLVIIAILLTGFGGIVDMFNPPTTVRLTKEHAWNDGIFLMLVAIFLVAAF